MGQGRYLMKRKEFFDNESFLETIPPNNEAQGNNEPYVEER
jgi:hypothetical protein